MTALDTMPAGLTDTHRAVGRLLLGTREGVTRYEGANRLDMHERAFREAVEEICASGWLPVLADRDKGGQARYRIAQPHEAERVAREAQEHYARAVSLHKRSRGLVQAFQHHHSAGALFVPDVPNELEVEHA